jgi:hypothetical protein
MADDYEVQGGLTTQEREAQKVRDNAYRDELRNSHQSWLDQGDAEIAKKIAEEEQAAKDKATSSKITTLESKVKTLSSAPSIQSTSQDAIDRLKRINQMAAELHPMILPVQSGASVPVASAAAGAAAGAAGQVMQPEKTQPPYSTQSASAYKMAAIGAGQGTLNALPASSSGVSKNAFSLPNVNGIKFGGM